MTEAPGLEVVDLVVRYGRVMGLDRVSLTVGPGEIVAVIGRSGSGKTSLLRAIAGLVSPASGRVLWAGADLTHVKTPKRQFGLVHAHAQLFPKLTVGENVAYGIKKWPRSERDRRVDELLGLVGMKGSHRSKVDDLAAGQAERVALARSLAPRPRVLLLDEPLAGLEPAVRATALAEVIRVLRRTETPAIYVTHELAEAFEVADRVAVLHDGRLHQIGPADDVRTRPASRDVAELLGYGTFIAGVRRDGTVMTAIGAIPGAGPDGDVLVGIGPEGLTADPDGFALPIITEQVRFGHVEIAVRLPDGQTGRLREVGKTGAETLPVRMVARGCAVLG